LLTLFCSDDTDLPQGIRLPAGRLPAGQEAVFRAMEPGQRITCQAGMLRVAGSGATIDLNGARRYASEVSGLNAAALSQAGQAAWRHAYGLLAHRQQEKAADLRIANMGLAGAASASRLAGIGQVAQYARRLALAARGFEEQSAQDMVRALVGLGGGLTPTGDDFLVGFLAGIWASAGEDARRSQWRTVLRALVLKNSRSTNDISRSYLVLACEGQFSSSLSQLAAFICRGAQPEQVRAAAEIVFQTGHTSGLDAATGLLAGFGAWNADLLLLV
jgi:hypothetical protein